MKSAYCSASVLAWKRAKRNMGAVPGVKRRRFVLCLSVAFAAGWSVSAFGQGDTAVADHFVSAAVALAEAGRWVDAETVLARAEAFAEDSSDLAYFQAVVRRSLERPAAVILAPVRLALAVNRWTRYDEAAGRLLEADVLIGIRSFDDALKALRSLPDSADRRWLRLRALVGLGQRQVFRTELAAALEAYPFDSRFPALFLTTADRRIAAPVDRTIMDLIAARLPYLIGIDPFFAIMAAPFIAENAERLRLVAAYRAQGGNDPRSLESALDLGLIGEADATAELFGYDRLPLALLRSVKALLRTDEAQLAFVLAARSFTGWIHDDADGDGRPESRSRYEAGAILDYAYDADQDGQPELELTFADGLPVLGSLSAAAPLTAADGIGAETAASDLVTIVWSRYPFVEKATVGGAVYYPAPSAMAYTPARLEAAIRHNGESALIFPVFDDTVSRLTEKSLVSFASVIERPGEAGGMERTELVRGVPLRTVASVDGLVVSIMTYRNGRPSFGRLDQDRDGRLETIRRYSAETGELEIAESDWNGDGAAEYSESYGPRGRTTSWDLDGDGRRERQVDEWEQ